MDLSGSQTEYENEEVRSLTLRQGKVEHRAFNSCTFIKCSFRETEFLSCKFQDCVFRHCDLSLVTLKKCSFKNTRFEDSQIIGVNWVDTNLSQTKFAFVKPVDFVKCTLNHSTFMGLNLKNVLLTRCIARDVSFEGTNLSQANCSSTDFTDSRFLHTDLTGADFTGATNYSIDASLNTLKKTKFSLPEAMSLLYSMDIILNDSQSIDEDHDTA